MLLLLLFLGMLSGMVNGMVEDHYGGESYSGKGGENQHEGRNQNSQSFFGEINQ